MYINDNWMKYFFFLPCIFLAFSHSLLAQERVVKDNITTNFFTSNGIVEENKLLVFISPDCSLCKNYIPYLKRLSNKYNKIIEFCYVFSGKTYDLKIANLFFKEYNLSDNQILDTAFFLSKQYSVSVTPEVVLIDKDNQVIYQGAIDNALEKLGRKRVVVTALYLEDAISQFVEYKQIMIRKTEAKGCFLNDY